MNIGHKIKRLRIKNNLTLEELASRCELTKGFLSQLERDLTSPSIATLNDICEALGISLADFFKEEQDEKAVFTADDFFVDDRDGYTVHWIVPNAQKNEMEPIMIDLQAGCTSQEIAPHAGEEFGYVLTGKIVLVNGSKEHTIKKGQTFYINGTDSHYLRNDAAQPARVLWICTPPIF